MLTQADIREAEVLLERFGIDSAAIDAEAAAILNNAARSVAKILARREALDKEGHSNEPLIVVTGENHSVVAHHLHHTVMLKMLAEKEQRTVLGCELPHNWLAQQVNKRASLRRIFKDATTSVPHTLHKFDPAGVVHLKWAFTHNRPKLAPYAHKILFNTCLKSGIPTRFTDAGLKKHALVDYRLDTRDPATADSMRACLPETRRRVLATSTDGMWVRNHHIVAKATEFANETNARILVQKCGDAHVLGWGRKDPAKHSLTVLFKEAGYPVLALPVLCTGFSLEAIPSDHGFTPDERHAVAGLPERTAAYRMDAGLLSQFLRLLTDYDFCSPQQEAAYINALLVRMGLHEDGLTLDDFKEKQEHFRIELGQTFRQWRRDLRAATP